MHQKLSYLWLGKHIQTPRAYFPISWDTNQIVSILGPNNIYTVHWVLRNKILSENKLEVITSSDIINVQ